MDKRAIQRNIGNVVAYSESSSSAVYPAKILDGRMWEKHPDQHVEVSRRSRSYRKAGLRVGYPVLLARPGVATSPADRRQLEQFLVNTTLTMGDLFDEEGNRKGDFLGENERLIFRVAFPHDLHEDYEGKRRERIAARRAHDAAMRAERIRHGKLRDQTVILSNILAGLGAESPDEFPIVSPANTESQRVSLPVSLLEELINIAAPLMRGCWKCGEHDHLLPQEHAGYGTIMLCATCHPRIH